MKSHRLVYIIEILIVCLVFIRTGIAEPDVDKENQRLRIQAISQELENYIAASGRKVQDEMIIEYIGHVIEKIAPKNGKLFKVVVSRSHEANAWVTALPIVHITTGMLTALDNEAQLAFILAHEIAHYNSGTIADTFFYKLNQLQKGITLSYRLNALFQSGAYSRERELLADKAAVFAYLKAGYSPAEISSLFDLFAQLEMAERYERSSPILNSLLVRVKTHPSPEDRLKIVEAFLDAYSEETGTYLGKKQYQQVMRPLWVPEIQQSLVVRDDSRLRVYFSQPNAKSRYEDLMYFYIAEAIRLGGTDEERRRLLPYYIAAQQRTPDFAPTYRALARLKWRQNDREAAKRYYRQYLKIQDNRTNPDYLGQDLGLLESTPLALSKNKNTLRCDDNRFISEKGYFEIQIPCSWYVDENLPYTITASKDGWGLNRILVYSIPYDFLLDPINETVGLAEDGSWSPTESGDDVLDIVEMCRAVTIKESDYPVSPAGTGFETINNRRWGWYEVTGRDSHGLTYRSRYYVTVVERFIVGVAYSAPDLYYYQAGLSDFAQSLSTLKILDKPKPNKP